MFAPETGIAGGFALLVLLLVALLFILYLVPIPLWIAAWASGAYVGLFHRHAPAPGPARHGGHGADQRGQGRA
jgi:hypothetical protein